MYNKFTELVNKKIACPDHNSFVAGPERKDQLCIIYNNFWGMASDTNMICTEDGKHLIIGYIFSNNTKSGIIDRNNLFFNSYYKNIDLTPSGYNNLESLLHDYNFHIEPGTHENQPCWVCVPDETESVICPPKLNIQYIIWGNGSNLPVPEAEYNFFPRQVENIISTSSNISSAVIQLNKSNFVCGKNWHMGIDNTIIGDSKSGKRIIIKLSSGAQN